MTRSLAAAGAVLALAVLPACDGTPPGGGSPEATTPTVVLTTSPSEPVGTTEADGAGSGEDHGETGPEVTAEDQAVVDRTVAVSVRGAPGPAFVVLHRDEGGAPGPVVGHVGIEGGDHEEVLVPLDDAVGGGVALWAMLHTDAGERGVYEFPGPDVPLRDAGGAVVMTPFVVDDGVRTTP